ncbi:MAG TPA: hypothetical protein VLC50_04235 [Actinomycetes bacterium]|nr:hypothetical protein [Actinomycetes bacterium]
MSNGLLTRVSTMLHRPSADDRVIVAGRVACPRDVFGDVDVDRCLSCPFFKGIHTSADGTQWLRCSSGQPFDRRL